MFGGGWMSWALGAQSHAGQRTGRSGEDPEDLGGCLEGDRLGSFWAWLKPVGGFSLLITGHSLGAGTAILCAVLLSVRGPQVAIVEF